MAETYTIFRSVVELGFYDQREAWPLQTRVSYLFQEKLKKIIEEECKRVDSPDLHYAVNLLDLDLGDIAEDELEQLLPQKLVEALRKSLAGELENIRNRSGTNGHVYRRTESTLRLLHHFLITGELPWNTDAARGTASDWLDELIKSEPSELIRLLRRTAKHETITRLVQQFSDAQLAQLITVLEPSEARFILRYAANLQTVQQQQLSVNDSSAAFREVRWRVIFNYLLVERGSLFNRRMFVKSTIAQLAAHYNISYSELIRRLAIAARAATQQSGVFASLPKLLLELEFENEAQQHAHTTAAPDKPDALALLSNYLITGALPAASMLTAAEFMQLIAQLPETEREALAELLRKTGIHEDAVERYLFVTRDPVRRKTVAALEPADAESMLNLMDAVTALQQRKQVVPDPVNDFKQQQWFFLFRFLLTERGSVFNTKMYVRSMLRQMAAHLNTNYIALVNLFGTAAAALKKELPVLQPLLELLSEQLSETPSEQHSTKTESVELTAAATDTGEAFTPNYISQLLLYILRNGRLPWWAVKSAQHSASEAGLLIKTLYRESPETLTEVLAIASRSETAFNRLVTAAGDFLPELLQLIPAPETQALDSWIVQLEAASAPLIQQAQRREKLSIFFRSRLLLQTAGKRGSNAVLVNWLTEVWGELTVRSMQPAATVFGVLLAAAAALPAQARLLLSGLLRQVYERAGGSVYDAAPVYAAQQTADTVAAAINRIRESEKQSLVDVYQNNSAVQETLTIIKDKSTSAQPTDEPVDAEQLNTQEQIQAAFELPPALRLQLAQQILRQFSALLVDTAAAGIRQLVYSLLKQIFGAHLRSLLPAAPQQLIDRQVNETLSALSVTEFLPALTPATTDLQKLIELLLRAELPQTSELDTLLNRLLRTRPDAFDEVLNVLFTLAPARKRFAELLHNTTYMRLVVFILRADSQSGIQAVLIADLLELANRMLPGKRTLVRELVLLLALQLPGKQGVPAVWLFTFFQLLCVNAGLPELKAEKGSPEVLAAGWNAMAQRYPHDWKSELPRLLEQLSQKHHLQRMADPLLQRLQQLRMQAAAEERKRFADEKLATERLKPEVNGESGVFVSNAGLVLLWPFFTRLFTRCGWLNGMQFASPEAAYRAVHLLHYIATKQEQPPEYQLVLNKLLCGISKAAPVVKELELTTEEKQIGEELLGAVIKQWTVLGNTSVQGLRETFLERNGQLLFTPEHVVLRVERKAFDKLLGRLPWAINLIRLPWMKQPLYVEWKT
jgi:Contractile injection system tape measure protein